MLLLVYAVVERVDGRQRCALLNATPPLSPPPGLRGATSAERRPGAGSSSVGLGDLTDTRLLWIVVMSALSGTCLVLLTVGVGALLRRVCCHVDQHQQPPHHSLSWRRRRRVSGGDCACRQQSSPPAPSRLQLADIQQSDDLATSASHRDASQV